MSDDEPFDSWSNADPEELDRARKLFEQFGEHKYDKVVAFVDMLGFSALTEAHRIDPEQMEELQRPAAVEFLTASLEDCDLLTQRFIRFHLLIEEAVKNARLPED